MGKHEVTIITDWTVPMASLHSAIWVPPPPPPVPVHPHFEMPAMMAHLPGIAKHKFTSTVFHQALPIAKDGHDVGNGIPHLTAPPHSVLLAWHLIFSGRKIMFGASTVKMDGDPTGIADLTGGCPMLMCAEPVSLPIQWAPTNATNTVYVGSSAADLILGWLAIGGNMLLDWILGKIGDAMTDFFKKKFKELWADLFSKAIGEALKWVIGKAQESFTAKPATAESSAASTAEAMAAAATTPATSTTSSPFGDASVTVTPNTDGTFSVDTSSPTSGGGRREERTDGLGMAAPADEERAQQPDELEDLFENAPVL